MFDLKTRVLVVDDMPTVRKIVAKACKDIGFVDITEAADGMLAWQVLCDAQPPIGLIISDWNMPNLTGIGLLKKVRSNSRYANTPFLMATAETEQHQITDAAKSGVSAYIVKPFTPQALRDKLEAIHAKYSK